MAREYIGAEEVRLQKGGIAVRRHLTYANVVATLALVFAMTGGALAAKHYLINSTSQINPKVLHKLTGSDRQDRSATGQTGLDGGDRLAGRGRKTGTARPEQRLLRRSKSVSSTCSSQENVTVAVGRPCPREATSSPADAGINVTERTQKVDCELVNNVNEAADESIGHCRTEVEGTTRHIDGQAVPVVEVAATLATAGHWELECAGSANSEMLIGRTPELTAQQVGAVSRTGS